MDPELENANDADGEFVSARIPKALDQQLEQVLPMEYRGGRKTALRVILVIRQFLANKHERGTQ